MGASQGGDDDELVFVTSDAQLLHFPASAVRPQGCPAGGMAGIKLDSGTRVIEFSVRPRADVESAVVVTVAAASDTLLGADPGAAKVSDSPVPGQGSRHRRRAGARFLKGQDALSLAWVEQGPHLRSPSTGPSARCPRAAAGATARASARGVVQAVGARHP